MSRLLALLLLLPSLAAAQGSLALSRLHANGLALSLAPREVTLCFVPDIQNQTSGTDSIAPSYATSCALTSPYCPATGCASSPLCSVSWHHTGEILLQNEAYSLTGQWNLIDYSKIRGADDVVSKRANPLDHGKCDAIIGLGDNLDTADGFTYAQLTADMLLEYTSALNFWKIIAASGIPWTTVRGNHEGEGVFDTLVTELGLGTSAAFYAKHSEGDQYAIKFSNATGDEICVVGMDDNRGGTPISPGDELTASELTWVTTNTGCGANLPTILVGHELIQNDGAPIAAVTTLLANAANDEIFLVIGGHYTPATPNSVKTSTTNAGGKTVLLMFSNWQEAARHNVSSNGSGLTVHDGNGGQYTVVTIHPQASRICAHDWNPYWQVRDGISNGQVSPYGAGSEACFAFDWDARY